MHPAYADQTGHLPNLISFHCLHVETLAPQQPIECTAKTDQTGRIPMLIWPRYFFGFVMRWLNYGKNPSNQQADYLRTFWCSGSVTRAVCVREVVGSIPGRIIPKTLKMVLAAPSRLRSALRKRNWSVRCPYNVTGWNFMSCF